MLPKPSTNGRNAPKRNQTHGDRISSQNALLSKKYANSLHEGASGKYLNSKIISGIRRARTTLNYEKTLLFEAACNLDLCILGLYRDNERRKWKLLKGRLGLYGDNGREN